MKAYEYKPTVSIQTAFFSFSLYFILTLPGSLSHTFSLALLAETGEVNVMDFGRLVLSDPRAPNSRRGSQRGRDRWEGGLTGLAELCFALLQLMERFLPCATNGDSSPLDISDKEFSQMEVQILARFGLKEEAVL